MLFARRTHAPFLFSRRRACFSLDRFVLQLYADSPADEPPRYCTGEQELHAERLFYALLVADACYDIWVAPVCF